MTTLADWIQSNFDSLVDHVIEQRRANGDTRPQAVMQEATRALLRAVIAGLGDNIDWIALGAMTAEELLGQGVTDVELAASAPAMVFEIIRTDLEKAAVAERNDWLVVLARELLQASRGLATAITAHARAEQKRLEAEVIDAQRAAIRELSTPIIPLLDGIIVLPLVGSIDTRRAQDILRSVLAGIREHRARILILDLTGVSIIDTAVAHHLNKTIRAAQLKGARTLVTGLSDAAAETFVEIGVDWGHVETLRDLQTGLATALKLTGYRLVQEHT